MDILHDKMLCVYIANMTKKPVSSLEFVIVAYESSFLTFIIHWKDDEAHMLKKEVATLMQCKKFNFIPSNNAA